MGPKKTAHATTFIVPLSLFWPFSIFPPKMQITNSLYKELLKDKFVTTLKDFVV